MSITLEELKRKRDEKAEELRELESAIKVLERYGNGESTAGTVTEISESGVINLDEIELPERSAVPKQTLADDVRSTIERFGKQDFTVNHVVAVLRKLGKKGSESKHFRNRVYQAVKQLAEERVIELAHKGVGSDPHQYRRVQSVSLVRSGAHED